MGVNTRRESVGIVVEDGEAAFAYCEVASPTCHVGGVKRVGDERNGVNVATTHIVPIACPGLLQNCGVFTGMGCGEQVHCGGVACQNVGIVGVAGNEVLLSGKRLA